ncbi:HPP family protein [Halosimplex halophilum]|uniref:HPP family protein n=1 Tax=Halosimplex halophilum TaxID=2559572 RepID=UPI00107F9172|nr:HPP family protein [Halosimplex halophilum]
MNRHAVLTGVHAGILLGVTGVVAWLTGTPFVFPSLGPTAYVLVSQRPLAPERLRRIVAGHGIGVVAGLLAYHLLASGVVVTADLAPRSPALAAVVASGVLALVLTSTGMLAFDAVHPPACATTLIVALGLLPTVREGFLIVAAVLVLVAGHVVALRLVLPAAGRFRRSEA